MSANPRPHGRQQDGPPDGEAAPGGDEPGEEGLARELGRGQSARTPFVLFFGVNLALFGLALAIALIVLLAVLLWQFV